MFDKLPFDPVKDFVPITIAVKSPAVLSVHPSLSPKTVDELVALIKANPGKYSFASGGTGTQPHLAGEQFRMSLGLDIVHVPHNGGGPALASAIAGHTPIIFSTLSPAVPFVKEGKLRALAITGKSPKARHGRKSFARRALERSENRLGRRGEPNRIGSTAFPIITFKLGLQGTLWSLFDDRDYSSTLSPNQT
jgi:Tripartite tricarboxylate transporter family receptor